jgi:hypothetical protein
MARTTTEVFEDHLALRKAGKVELDIERNYAKDVALLGEGHVFRGHDGVRSSAKVLNERLPGAEFEYRVKLVHEEFAYLEWSGHNDGARIDDGVDAFLIRDGLIVTQSAHYTVKASR